MKRLEQWQRSLQTYQKRLKHLHDLAPMYRDMDWQQEHTHLVNQIDRLKHLIQQEESCQASSR